MLYNNGRHGLQISKKSLPTDLLTIYLCGYVMLGSLVSYVLPVAALRSVLFSVEIVLFLYYLVKHRIYRFELPVLLPLLVMALLPVFTYGTNGLGLAGLLLWISTFLAAMLVSRGRLSGQQFLRVILFFAMIHAACTILFFFTPGFYRGTVVNLFPSSRDRLLKMYSNGCMAGITNHYSVNGNYLVLGLLIPFAQMMAGEKSKKAGRNAKLLFAVLMVALLLTGKRGQLIFGLMAMFVVYYFKTRTETRKLLNAWTRTLGILLVALTVGVMVISAVPALSTAVRRLQESIGSDDLDNGRYAIWALAMDSFKSHPILGIGWHTFKSDVSYLLGSSRLYDVHNVYLQLLCETGVVGFVFFMTWFVTQFAAAIRCFLAIFRRPDTANTDRVLIAFALGYQAYFLMYCFTGNPLYDYNCYLPYFLSCGIVMYYRRADLLSGGSLMAKRH